MKAWHCIGREKRINHGDCRIVEQGKTYTCEFPFKNFLGETHDKPTLCKAGMHGSQKTLHALGYFPSNIICKVELSGDIVRGDDKAVARERKVLAMIDGGEILRKFACMCALDVIDQWDAPEIAVRYLRTLDGSLKEEIFPLRDCFYPYDSDARRSADAAWAAITLRPEFKAAIMAVRFTPDSLFEKQNARLTRMVNKAIKEQEGISNGVT